VRSLAIDACPDPDVIDVQALRLHGWRGRLCWLPVGALHGPVTRSMMRRAVSRIS
jgi:hypothetical protein